MTIFSFVQMAGGVALFLYGMSVMGNGLEKLSGGKMEQALERMTTNIFTSVLLGAVVTALIQSSSATTVIVVGLVNAGILQLRQAVGVIMGANIGTTVTAQLIRLSDIESDSIVLQFFKPTTLAPLAAVIGIVLFMSAKRAKIKEIGQMLVGFGILFAGMFAMEAAVKPLQSSPVFPQILAAMSNPILGVLAGAIITAAIQSSAASIGMLQALSSTGLIHFNTAFPIIMGQNIGTCITPILSSIGASKNAKRSAMIHLYFNIVGTIGFLAIIYGIKAMFGPPSFWEASIGRTEIANFHTFFNITVTLCLIPFAGLIERMAVKTIRDGEVSENEKVLELIDERFLKSPSIALQQSAHVVNRMAEFSQQNYLDSISMLVKYDSKMGDRINEVETLVDKIEDKLENYLIRLSGEKISAADSRSITALLHMLKEYERISDYSINLVECAEELHDHNLNFSEQAIAELDVLMTAVSEIIDVANAAQKTMSAVDAKRIEPLEETIDAMVEWLKDMHVERLKQGQCQVHGGITFLEILTNLERISDHCSNIGVYIISNHDELARKDSHAYIKHTHEATDREYVGYYTGYMEKYYEQLSGDQKEN